MTISPFNNIKLYNPLSLNLPEPHYRHFLLHFTVLIFLNRAPPMLASQASISTQRCPSSEAAHRPVQIVAQCHLATIVALLVDRRLMRASLVPSLQASIAPC